MLEARINKKLISPNGEFNLNIELNIKPGEFITVFGASGAGKTTLLRALAGLEKPDHGYIRVDKSTWFDPAQRINLQPNRRSVGLVFQNYALFPNMTVEENILYGISEKRDNLSKDIISLMDLNSFLDSNPETLSGGQAQRVALARTMVTQPKILLLDEPMAALDVDMRSKIQDYLIEAHKRYHFTTILVSHDIGEIFKLSDRVIKLEDGSEVASGKPSEVFFKKGSTGRFQFTGEILEITKEDVVYVVTILIGQQIVKVIAEEKTAAELRVGENVLVTSKAFNPIIQKTL